MVQIISSAFKQLIDGLNILEKKYNNSAHFLRDLVNEIGPVYLILDEIGSPFNNVEQNCESFWNFLICVMSEWFKINGFFFLLVGNELLIPPKGHKYCLERIPLYPLTKKDIRLILEKTMYSTLDHRNLIDYYGIMML